MGARRSNNPSSYKEGYSEAKPDERQGPRIDFRLENPRNSRFVSVLDNDAVTDAFLIPLPSSQSGKTELRH